MRLMQIIMLPITIPTMLIALVILALLRRDEKDAADSWRRCY